MIVFREHGRREKRSIWVSGELNDYLDFAGVAQVFAVRRETVEVKSARRRCETAYGVTSLTPTAASPQRLLALNRGHWIIEATHHILDWSFDEDRSRIRTGHGPENMTLLRRFAIGVIKGRKLAPHPEPAEGRRDHAQSRQEPAPRPRLPQNDRQHRPEASARLPPLRSRIQRLAIDLRQSKGGRSCPDHARLDPRVHADRRSVDDGNRITRPPPAPTPDKAGQPMIERRETATKIRTNLPWPRGCTSHL